MKEKFEQQSKLRLEEYRGRTVEMDEREKELCLKTNQLVDELVTTCEETPFHKALLHILGNMKGTIKLH